MSRNVVGTTSTATEANAQILIGSSFTGGLLLNGDTAAGRDFVVDSSGDGSGGDGDDPDDACPAEGIEERFAGTIVPGEDSVDEPFTLRCTAVNGMLTYHPGHQDLELRLVDDMGQVVAISSHPRGRKISAEGLEPGDYAWRVVGPVEEPVDYVVRSDQE